MPLSPFPWRQWSKLQKQSATPDWRAAVNDTFLLSSCAFRAATVCASVVAGTPPRIEANLLFARLLWRRGQAALLPLLLASVNAPVSLHLFLGSQA